MKYREVDLNDPQQRVAWQRDLCDWLGETPDFQQQNLEAFLKEGTNVLPGPFFYCVTYEDGEVVMPKGVTNDYAILLLKGGLQFLDREANTPDAGPGCWGSSLLRSLDSAVRRVQTGLEKEKAAAAEKVRAAKAAASPPEGGPVPGTTNNRRNEAVAEGVARASRRVRRSWLGCLASLAPGFFLAQMRSADRYWVENKKKPVSEWPPKSISVRIGTWLAAALYERLGKVERPERRLADRADPDKNPLIDAGTKTAAAPPDVLESHPLEGRYLGVTRVILNQPWEATLRARTVNANLCQVLMIRRIALIGLIKPPDVREEPVDIYTHKRLLVGIKDAPERLRRFCTSHFFVQQSTIFIKRNLASLLAENRLFRDLLYEDDVTSWGELINRLRAALHKPADPRWRHKRFTRAEADRLMAMNPESPSEDERTRVLVLLNGVLGDPDWGSSQGATPAERAGGGNQSGYAKFRRNREQLRELLPNALKEPEGLIDFEALANTLTQKGEKLPGILDRAAGEAVYGEGEGPNHLYLISSGLVEVASGPVVVNNLKAGGYFGATCPVATPRTARAVARTTLLRIDAADLGRLTAELPWLAKKIERERIRDAARDAARQRGTRRPPAYLPSDLAAALQPAQNVLLIDMDRCTRCDQCVRGCAEAHEGQPRFHRANPKMRFGNWEVAGACLHCVNAPCQLACPVGAIALLADGAVQIHRNRCIGCSACEQECPYGVIDMVPPLSGADGTPTAINKDKVANKCDLCLTDQYDPPCVACCPYDAAHRVDPAEAFPGFRSRAAPS